MEKLGRGMIVYGDDVESLVFDWGTIKFLSEPEITGVESFSFGMVVLAPGQGHERHNHPGVEEIIFVMSGEGEQMVDHNHRFPCVRVPASLSLPTSIIQRSTRDGSRCGSQFAHDIFTVASHCFWTDI